MPKITPEDKAYYCHQYLIGNMSQGHIAKITGLAPASIHMWIKNYESLGNDAFLRKRNKRYSKELKVQAVEAFLAGKDSQYGICKSYGIKSTTQLQMWILKYNSHEKLKTSGTGGATII
ncbi:hypothetical protein [Anaerotignum sp.]|uniref:hypothetical protein n=1 Tax=Anaerotignum sp. TaxID=2039241 RepID=UPI00271450C7|nr:hypothetical protein [Anaerotignum sp.]